MDRTSPLNRILSAAGACLAAAGVTAALLMAVYALRGIWPFGADNVAYIDTAQYFIPDYYALWDAMHGARAAGLNWFAGLAESGASGWAALLQNDILWPCFLNPANWVFLFVARDHILEVLSFYLAVYMALTAASACLALRLRFPGLGTARQIAFSLVYAFSGYVLQYYFSFGWFIVVILFPLLLLGLERLLREGRYVLYAVTYTLLVSLNVYFTYMLTIYILLFAFLYSVFLLPREQRGDRAFRLGLSTVFAFGAAAYRWTDNLAAFTGTSRFDSNLSSGLINGFSTWNIPYTALTTLMLLGSALLLAVLVGSLRRPGGGDRRVRRFFACLMGALLVPMVFTNIDTAWHFGQYNFFPMRYGFVLPATLIAAAAAALERRETDRETEPAPRALIAGFGAVLCAAALLFLEPRLTARFHEFSSTYLTIGGARDYWLGYFPLFVGCGLLFTLLYLCLFRLKRRAAALLTGAVLLLQLGVNAWGLIAPNDDHSFAHEYDPAYIEMADDLHARFAGEAVSPLSRSKNLDNSLNAGYPVLAGAYALSSVNSLNSSDRLAAFRALGYTTNYFCLLDTGGTVFSDMLLGVDRALTLNPPDGDLYADTGDTAGAIRISEALYPGVTGLQFPTGALDGVLSQPRLADRLNALYAAFTESGGTAAVTPDFTLDAQGEGLRTYTLSVELTEPSFLYIAADAVMMNLAADGRGVPVPTYRNEENRVYPASFNSNLLSLGLCGPGTVTVSFMSGSDVQPEDISLTALSRQRMESFAADARRDGGTAWSFTGDGLSVTLAADRDGLSLFLPMTWSARWHARVNGRPAELTPVLDTLMSVPLDSGENVITMTYHRDILRPTLAVSLLFIAGGVLWLILRRRPIIAGKTIPAPVCRAAWRLFAAAAIAALLFVYAAPAALLLIRGTVVPI